MKSNPMPLRVVSNKRAEKTYYVLPHLPLRFLVVLRVLQDSVTRLSINLSPFRLANTHKKPTSKNVFSHYRLYSMYNVCT